MSLLERIIVIGIIGTLSVGLTGGIINSIQTVNNTLNVIQQQQLEHEELLKQVLVEVE